MTDNTASFAWMDSVLTQPTASPADIDRLISLCSHDDAATRAHAVDTLSATMEYFDLAPRLIAITPSAEVAAGLATILEEMTADAWPKRPDASDLSATGPRVVWQIADHLGGLTVSIDAVDARIKALLQRQP